ncbi:MAG: aspartyl beta-hydroxylase, partial [Betaproteobacteria bacterium]
MENSHAHAQEIAALKLEVERVAQLGRDQEVSALLGRILDLDPNHVPTLAVVAHRAFRQGDMETAHSAFQRMVDIDGSDPKEWINLALVCRNQKDEPGEQRALKRALSLDPRDLLGLILRADLLERQGKTHEAAAAHRAVATVAPPMERLHPDLKPAVQRALAFGDKYNREFAVFLDQFLEQEYKDHAGENLKRFRDSVDIMLG